MEKYYYPFGLEMAGISDQAMGKLDSKNKFNGGTELEEEYGVNLYSTFYRKYDPQIGRFSGVDILSEKSINVSVYQFALNDPIRMNDPFGSRETATGGGGSADYLSEWNDIFNTLYYGDGGQYGGKWLPSQNASGGGYSFFSSDQEAFMYGSMDMDRSNSWGNDGFATSLKNAKDSYYKNGGTDPNVAYLAPNIYLRGFSKPALEDLDAQIARNAQKANNLADQYETNENRAMAYSFTMEALFETTETGQLLTKVRESMVQTYGDRSSKEASEVYSNAIEIIRGIKERVPNGKMSDLFINATAFTFGVAASSLQAEDQIIGLRIEMLDENVYDNRILKMQNYPGGGGGASGKW